MTIDVDKVSQLSKLRIDADKKPMFEKQMNDIAQMAEVLAEVGTQQIAEDTCRALLRNDSVNVQSFGNDKALQNASFTKDGFFCVPKTVE